MSRRGTTQTAAEGVAGEPTPMFAERQRAERLATLSACCGATGDVTLTNSAMIILFAATMGASDMLSMLTTSLHFTINQWYSIIKLFSIRIRFSASA